MDLNIENYDLDDILNLFKMPKNFVEEDLKAAKKYYDKYYKFVDNSSSKEENPLLKFDFGTTSFDGDEHQAHQFIPFLQGQLGNH
jgi:hypothetical protein